jgi:multicomponent Na+:H+ antiporter subunit E
VSAADVRAAADRPAWRRNLVGRVTVLAWLAVVWVMLWGTWDIGTMLSGVLVALAVVVLLPLPRVALERTLRPWRVAALVLVFLRDLVVASIQVAWLAVRPGPPLRSAVIGVPLRTTSDLILTVVTEMLTLVPGSVVIEVSQEEHSLYAHVLDVRDVARAAEFRLQVLALEARVARAIGTAENLRELEEGRS